MFVLYIFILFLLFYGARVHSDGIYSQYISKQQCNCIKGFFIVVVFCRHIAPYLEKAGYDFSILGDSIFRSIDSSIGQLLVVMFLFYSGYGVSESIKFKGAEYVRNIPRNRLLKTLCNFDIAILVFLVINMCLDIHHSASDILLAFTGWEAIGNSNWYIFVILCCYLITYLTYTIAKRFGYVQNRLFIFGGGMLLFGILYVILYKTRGAWWHNTLFAYPIGSAWSLYKVEVEKLVKNKYLVCLGGSLLMFIICYISPINLKGLMANLAAIFFATTVVLVTMKLEFKSKALEWCGKLLFPLYIYQRTGMLIFSTIDGGTFIQTYPYAYILICAVITILCGWGFKYIQVK